jgi:polyhydroxyalkanoate synthesis regulator phasin
MNEMTVKEAIAYEGDDYAEHTVETYMKENAAMAASLAAEAMKEAYSQVKEGEMTLEMYEANCDSMKEAYSKKMDEMKEAYAAEGEEAVDDTEVGPTNY